MLKQRSYSHGITSLHGPISNSLQGAITSDFSAYESLEFPQPLYSTIHTQFNSTRALNRENLTFSCKLNWQQSVFLSHN